MNRWEPGGAGDDESYQDAVDRAGVIELPDAVPTRCGLPDGVAGGRFEDDDPPGAPR